MRYLIEFIIDVGPEYIHEGKKYYRLTDIVNAVGYGVRQSSYYASRLPSEEKMLVTPANGEVWEKIRRGCAPSLWFITEKGVEILLSKLTRAKVVNKYLE